MVKPILTPSQNLRLNQVFLREEIETSLGQMFPTKSPGVDGMSALFYQKYWGVVSNDVVGYCLNVLNGGASVKEINHTLLTLIPKVDNPVKVTEFRPIRLCTVIYKMIFKTIVNRLKPIMPLIISEFQSAFVLTRLITDNIIAAFESIHAIKRRGGSKLKQMVLKLDMSKAYDRVEWTFIEAMLKRLGFTDRWVELIMDCISTVTYSVQVRGVASGMIVPSRGLCQGDPLSPYLFLICAEGLFALLSNALKIKRISGISVAQGAPTISHLFFADHSLFFCNAHLADCAYLLQILSMYERASGQKINFDKSAVCFSPNTDPVMKQLIADMLGVPIVTCHERYLGLHTLAQRNKSRMFNHVREQVWRKLNTWDTKLLSTAGKEVLIKAVGQALPTYTMGVFKLPKSLCQELSAMIARYWWGKSGRKGIHWLGWRKLCKPKCLGGLGFRHFEAFNKAMVAKQAWRILENPTSLVAKILKARYFPEDDFMRVSLGSSLSMIWKSILWGREVIEDGLLWRVGNGVSIRVLHDRWIPKPFTFKPLMTRGLAQTSMVSDFLMASGSWNLPVLEQHFSLED
ncbi:unnamed protein product [Prunus armeniaca]